MSNASEDDFERLMEGVNLGAEQAPGEPTYKQRITLRPFTEMPDGTLELVVDLRTYVAILKVSDAVYAIESEQISGE